MARSKSFAEQIDISEDGAHQLVVLVQGLMSQSGFYHMPCVVEFVHVSQIGKPLSRLDNRVMQVEVSIWLLSMLDQLHELVNGDIQLWICMVVQQVASAFNPF